MSYQLSLLSIFVFSNCLFAERTRRVQILLYPDTSSNPIWTLEDVNESETYALLREWHFLTVESNLLPHPFMFTNGHGEAILDEEILAPDIVYIMPSNVH